MIIEYSDELRRALPVNTHAEKLSAAIEWMGPKYSLHPSNHVSKLKQPLMLERTMEPKVLRRVK